MPGNYAELLRYTYTVIVAITLTVVEAVMLLIAGKVVVRDTVWVVSIHLTQTVLTKALACATRLLNATCLASFEAVVALVVIAVLVVALVVVALVVVVVVVVALVVEAARLTLGNRRGHNQSGLIDRV